MIDWIVDLIGPTLLWGAAAGFAGYVTPQPQWAKDIQAWLTSGISWIKNKF
jgi:hypothetical protein